MSETHKKTNNKKDDFLIQGAILAIAAVVTKIIGVAYRIPLTNILGDEGNGFYGYAFEIYSVALILSSFSYPLAVSKLVSARMAMHQKRNAFRVFLCALVFSIVVGLAVSLFIFFGAEAISTNVMKSPLSFYALKMLAPGLLIVSVMGVIRGYFQGLGTMIPTALSQIIEQIINAIVSIVGAAALFKVGMKEAARQHEELLGPAYGASGGTLGTVAGAFAGLIFLLFILYLFLPKIKRQLRTDRTKREESYSRIMKIMILTIVPVIFSTAIGNINQIIDMYLFNQIMALQGFAEKEYMSLLGIYTGKYNTLINVPLAVANGLAASVIPSLAVVITSGNKTMAHEKINQTLRLTMLIAIPCFAGFVSLASPLMILLFNDPSSTPACLLSIGAITVVFSSISTVTSAILQGLDKMMAPVKNAAIALVFHIISLVVMLVVFKWNIYALVGSSIVFSLCSAYLNIREIKKTVKYHQETTNTFVKPIIASAIMGGIAYIIYTGINYLAPGRVIPVLAAIMFAAVTYAVCVLKFGTLSKQDILALPKGQMIYRISRKMHLLPKKRR